MEHKDHVRLLREGVTGSGPKWAEFGSGHGAFTLALADLLGADGQIYSFDLDRSALRAQEKELKRNFPAVTVKYQLADFTRKLEMPLLDGILMANSLHFVQHKEQVLRLMYSYLRPGGRLLLVEYNADHGNPWVPYPLSYPTWAKLSQEQGFRQTRLIATIPSRFLHEIYAAVSVRE